jgi:hypothetical protein
MAHGGGPTASSGDTLRDFSPDPAFKGRRGWVQRSEETKLRPRGISRVEEVAMGPVDRRGEKYQGAGEPRDAAVSIIASLFILLVFLLVALLT